MKEKIIIEVDGETGYADSNYPQDPRGLLPALHILAFAAVRTFGEEEVREYLEDILENKCGGEKTITEVF